MPSPFDPRPWTLAHGRALRLGPAGLVMAIINVTPDSFSDGGLNASCAAAVVNALKAIGEGAAIIDVGGESTRPGAAEVSASEEQDRVLPVIEALARQTEAVISIDTYRAETARLALAAGAHVVNDVHGLQREPEIADVAARAGAGVVIMHTGRGRAKDPDVIADQRIFLDRSLAIARAAGLSGDAIVLDPGFGFDMMRLSASRSEIVVQQQRDLDAHVHDNDELSALIDRIAARIGGKRVVVHLPVDTHIPERAALPLPAQHNLAATSTAAWPERVEGEPPLRPLRLFERPEAIQVIAGVPDGPPARFVWRRAAHAVIRAEGPERVAMEWWRPDGQGLTRDYFRVEDEHGLRFWLYRDGLYDREFEQPQNSPPVQPAWYMHGLFA